MTSSTVSVNLQLVYLLLVIKELMLGLHVTSEIFSYLDIRHVGVPWLAFLWCLQICHRWTSALEFAENERFSSVDELCSYVGFTSRLFTSCKQCCSCNLSQHITQHNMHFTHLSFSIYFILVWVFALVQSPRHLHEIIFYYTLSPSESYGSYAQPSGDTTQSGETVVLLRPLSTET